jgi:hypothetical protein
MKFQSLKLSKLNNKHSHAIWIQNLIFLNIYMLKYTCMNHELALKT